MMLQVNDISGGYGNVNIIKDVSFSVSKGEIFGVLGPNGSGKTTLLKMVSGLISTQSGEIILEDKNILAYASKELARQMAVLPQQSDTSFSYTVEEVVQLGRYPHQKGWFQVGNKKDKQIVDEAMELTGIYRFKDIPLHSLSGGERQRVMLARALAQEPKILLLDEPTNHLDISYQMSLLDSLKQWSKEKGLTVIAILHDLNMASLYCDRILLLDEGRVSALDRPAHVMNEKRLQEVYKAKVGRREHPSVPSPLITLQPKQCLSTERSLINRLKIERNREYINISSPIPLKTYSSAVIGAGFGWNSTFINRHVHKDYNCDCAESEYKQYLSNLGIDYEGAVGMMTAAILEDGSFKTYSTDEFTVFVVVTAGVSNAVDASMAYLQKNALQTVGTINTWIFIEGHLSDAAFVQAVMTSTEAKAKALFDQNIKDPQTDTLATGTSTDSIMVAASQTGNEQPYAGTITSLGKTIARAVHEATYEAVKRNKERRRVQ
ncbi:heme ABC transporter ATP-binding protein [Alkalihalobacterium elongatum]|uniref:heme ABC transporter ATP-binding protein n=1 Tax=Alkalihalobacterium elongatum TaxID=2675466 RepID=UPI002E28A064|nr:heme ABC transporter ATP-binding protein [Alkalihalobacterium elongatum]